MSKAVEISATEFNNKHGPFLDEACAGVDVLIRRHNKIIAVMISKDRYEKLESLEQIFDDYILNRRIKKAKKNMLSRKESDALTKKIMAAIK